MSTVIAEKLVLCRYSRSEILQESILHECPLQLTSSQHSVCPCKHRRKHVTQYDLRVIECLFPRTYRGEEIHHPEKFRAAILKSMSKPSQSKGPSMSTAVANPPKNNGQSTKTAAPQTGRESARGIWLGVPIPIIGVCGEKWTGKTLFAASIDPQHTLMLDLEDSSASYNGIPFARRISLYEEMLAKYGRVPTPLECFKWFQATIEALQPCEFTVLAVDPITDIEQGMVDWVYAHPEHFGHTKAQYDKAAGIMWGDVKSYWKMLLGIVATKVETLVFTAHMGAVWKGNSPVEGKRKAKGKETLFELASLYLQLERPLDEHGKQSDKPSARVLKSRLALSEFVDGEIVHKPILPPYLKVATPRSIREYIKSPPNYAKLKASEVAPPEQMTEDDRLLIKAGIAENERAAAEANLSRLEQLKRAAEEQARMKREREAQQEANAAQVNAAAPAGLAHGGASSTPGMEAPSRSVVTSSGTVLPASHEALSEIQECSDRAVLRELQAKIKDLFAALQLAPAKIAEIVEKRGVKTVEALNLQQAEELRGKLQDILNKRAAAAKSQTVPF